MQNNHYLRFRKATMPSMVWLFIKPELCLQKHQIKTTQHQLISIYHQEETLEDTLKTLEHFMEK